MKNVKNKKIYFIVGICLIIILLIVECVDFYYNKRIKSDVNSEYVTGESNRKSTDLQIKIINNYVNIRKSNDINSEIIGRVYKDSLFDVIDYSTDEQFLWIHIKTNNNIEGYVGSYLNSLYYEFINGTIDFTSPTINILVDSIEIDSISELTDDYINSIITYSDDVDDDPVLTYDISENGGYYYVTFNVTDGSNNVSSKKIKLIVNNEKMASNGEWITYSDARALRTKFVNIVSKYGEVYDFSCLTNTYWRMDFNSSSSFISVFTDSSWLYGCYYKVENGEFILNSCNDAYGSVSYDDIKNKIATQEDSAKKTYTNIMNEYLKTGYSISDLYLFS